MRTTILDTNILRSISDEKFDRIIECEERKGIQQFADPWTLMELIAHLANPQDRVYRPCLAALRRCVKRALVPSTEQPRVIEPSELQVSRAVFGNVLPSLKKDFVALINLSRSIAFPKNASGFAAFVANIQSIAQHVEEKERWFAQYFGDLRREIEVTESCTRCKRDAKIRSFTRSPEMLQKDAVSLVTRAYRQAGQEPPDPLPLDIISRVLATSQSGSAAVSLLLERIICDNANLEKSHIRNLIWDQEVAGSMGQTIGGFPVLLVTEDAYFAKAAEISGNKEAVCGLEEYLIQLELSS